MFYKPVHAFKGYGMGLNDKNQILLSQQEILGKSGEYFLVTDRTQVRLPSGFIPCMLNNVGQILGYRDEKIVILENDQFREIGVGEIQDFNNQGDIVGSTDVGGETHPCRWDANGLSWVGDVPGVATAINELHDMIVVETEDFRDHPYSGETPFDVAVPHSRSFCIVDGRKIPLLGLDGEASRVKALDIDNDRRIVGYSLHSSADVELTFDSPYGIPDYGSAGNLPILWVDFQPRAIPLPSYSAGGIATTLGPKGIILGYSAHEAVDFPTSTYAQFEDEPFWNLDELSLRTSSMTWGHPYMSNVHGINAQGYLLAGNPSSKDLVLFAENPTCEQDYLEWAKKVGG